MSIDGDGDSVATLENDQQVVFTDTPNSLHFYLTFPLFIYIALIYYKVLCFFLLLFDIENHFGKWRAVN